MMKEADKGLGLESVFVLEVTWLKSHNHFEGEMQLNVSSINENHRRTSAYIGRTGKQLLQTSP